LQRDALLVLVLAREDVEEFLLPLVRHELEIIPGELRDVVPPGAHALRRGVDRAHGLASARPASVEAELDEDGLLELLARAQHRRRRRGKKDRERLHRVDPLGEGDAAHGASGVLRHAGMLKRPAGDALQAR
jgi:hypothetical protein